jgi:hypothetical protein
VPTAKTPASLVALPTTILPLAAGAIDDAVAFVIAISYLRVRVLLSHLPLVQVLQV